MRRRSSPLISWSFIRMRFSPEKDTALAGFAADEGKAEEIEGLRLAETTLSASGCRAAAELDQAGLVRMQRQRELLKPRPHRLEEPTGVGLVLEAGL
jgi:hypothetical protein